MSCNCCDCKNKSNSNNNSQSYATSGNVLLGNKDYTIISEKGWWGKTNYYKVTADGVTKAIPQRPAGRFDYPSPYE